ncbi:MULTISPECIES: hypothetical protein [Neisseria]|uniref:hypothetical protein n=1 Tax=Neisseria TaxID=482 RepID=UPI0008A211A5|nr:MULTISPECIES: hypothetical protein [Neisseria]MBY6283285.1 hypothetical protein [Neisseria flava]OFN83398.1 hypothetical protein HMPREF2572_00095 [Neisseria sp. HMSC064E01]QTM24121.1 hypothetical protein J7445_05305 [Neisseria sicca]
MEKILEIIIKYLEEGNYKIATIIIGLLLPVAIVWKSKDFLEYWSNRQNFRRRLLEEIINKIQKTEIKNFLEGELIKEYFVRVFKFNAEVIFIEKLIDFHSFLNGEFTFNQIIKSKRYIKFKEGKLSIKTSFVDWVIDALIYYVIAFILFIFAASIILLLNFASWQYSLRGLFVFIAGVVIFIFSVLIRIQAIPYENAKKLQLKLEQFDNQQLDYHI